MNNTIKELYERQSVRIYTNEEISKEDKELIINSAIQAPNAGNMQLYSIIDVTNQEIKDKLAILCDNQPFISKAKMVLIFCADYEKWFKAFSNISSEVRKPGMGDLLLSMEDAIIAAQNSVVAGWSLGIGSCYIGDIMENHEEIVDLLNLPEHVYPACMVVYGHIDYDHIMKNKPSRVDNKYVVFENEYKNLSDEELRDMFEPRTLPKGYEEWMKAFLERKYNSSFCDEMCRSAEKYIERYKK